MSRGEIRAALGEGRLLRLAVRAAALEITEQELIRRALDAYIPPPGERQVAAEAPPDRPQIAAGEGVGGGESLSLWEGEEEQVDQKPRKKKRERTPRVSSPLPEIPPDLDTDEWQGAPRLWLEYKAERGQSYKPKGLEGLWLSLRHLGPRVGVPSIHRAVGNRWQGITAIPERDLAAVLPFAPPDPELAWRVEEVWASRVYAYREYQRQNVGVAPSVDPVLTPALRGLIEQAVRTFDGYLEPHNRAAWRRDSIARAAGIGHFYSAWHIGEDPKTPGMKQLGHDLPWRNGNTQRFADLYFETRDLSEAAKRARR